MKGIKGFTLLELLIVLFIISILSSMTVLSTGDFGRGKNLQVAGEELSLRLKLAIKEALLRQTAYGIAIDSQGYQFFQFRQHYPDKGSWQSLEKQAYWQTRNFPPQTVITLNLPQKTTDARPNIIINPNGDLTPFTLVMRVKNSPSSPAIQVSSLEKGEVMMKVLTSS